MVDMVRFIIHILIILEKNIYIYNERPHQLASVLARILWMSRWPHQLALVTWSDLYCMGLYYNFIIFFVDHCHLFIFAPVVNLSNVYLAYISDCDFKHLGFMMRSKINLPWFGDAKSINTATLDAKETPTSSVQSDRHVRGPPLHMPPGNVCFTVHAALCTLPSARNLFSNAFFSDPPTSTK